MSDIIDWLLALGGRRRRPRQDVKVIPAKIEEEPKNLKPAKTEPVTMVVTPNKPKPKIRKAPVTWRRGHKTTLRERRETFMEACKSAHEQSTRRYLCR